MSVKMYSQNVTGMRDFVKRRKIFNFFKDRNVDVLCLQETHSVYKDEKFGQSEWGIGKVVFAHGENNSRGVAICFGNKFKGKILETTKDPYGRFLIISLKIDDREILLTNTYRPNQDSPEFFIELFKQMGKLNTPLWIMGGDFNLILEPVVDRKSPTGNHKPKNASHTLKEFMEQYELIDVWRKMHPQVKRFSWHGRVNLASRIDFFLVSSALMADLVKSDIISTPISDNSALYLELKPSQGGRGKGFWKLNEKYLEQDEYVKLIEQSIERVLIKNQEEKLDPLMNWEMVKNEVVGQTIVYSVRKSKEEKVEFEQYQQRIQQLEEYLDNLDVDSNDAQKILDELINEKHTYDVKYLDKVQRIISNTKAHYYNEGEANTKYFFNMQKNRYVNNCMNKVYLEDGSTITERGQILKEQKRFYEQVYSSDPLVLFSLENENEQRKLTEHEAELLDEPLSIEEVFYSVCTMAKGKTPGSDGLTPSFYVKFWDKLSACLMNAFREALQRGSLHTSGRIGILNLIPKKNRDSMYLENWRPITLLNTDYKILAKNFS